MRRFAITDIHGCVKTFWALLEKIDFSKTDELYLLGDYVDRGPNSKGVIDLIFDLRDAGHTLHCLKGNHEEMLLNALHDSRHFDFWYRQGGLETLISFSCLHPKEIAPRYLTFFENLDYYFEVDQFLLVHAGFNFQIDDPFADQSAMLWARNWYATINKDWLGKRLIVHGHTPTRQEEINWQCQHLEQEQVLVIDNGCVYPRPNLGTLTAFDLGSQKLYFQKRLD